MIKTLRENYHQLVGRLTYRQRYVILGLLFFIFVPIPTYFAFKALNFYSQNNAMQRMGITYQRAISALFTHALEYERSKTSGTSQIAEDFDQLKAVEEAGSAAITSALGPGFTIEKSLLIDTTTWQQSWKTALQTTNFKQFNILLKNELEHVGLHLNLFGNTEGVIYSLMEPTVDYLAEAQLLIAESFFLKDEVAQLSTRERLQKNALASLEKYQAAYRIIRQHYPKETSFQNQMQDQQSVYFAALDQFQKKRDVASALNGLKTAQQFRELILDRMDDLLFRQKNTTICCTGPCFGH